MGKNCQVGHLRKNIVEEALYSIIIRQNNPIYKFRRTSKGEQKVNSVLFDKKQLYRKWTGGGHKVHTSNSVDESYHDIFFYLIKNMILF